MNNCNVFVINNLTDRQAFDDDLPNIIYQTIVGSLERCNAGEYPAATLQKMIDGKSVDKIREKLGSVYFVYIADDDGNIMAFAGIDKRGDDYYYCWLRVLPEYQGMGLAQHLCKVRDNFIRSKQAERVFIESLVFEGSLKFHTKQGFKIHGDQSGLTVTVRMVKNLCQ